MTSYLAVTTCSGEQWQKHGRAMARTFCRHWPSAVTLLVYSEGFSASNDLPLESIDLEIAAPWLVTFKALYRDPKYNGGSNGRDYRHDAVRFAHKIAALGAAAEDAECDVLIWIDADTVTHSPVTVEWLDSLFPESAVVAWLDRDGVYPECGFVMYRMPAARRIIRDVVKAYRNGAIFKLPEWHDSFVMQHYVRQAGVPVHSLSGPEGRRLVGHPWMLSPLAEKMDHLKGESRKSAGRSPLPPDVKKARTEPYWQ